MTKKNKIIHYFDQGAATYDTSAEVQSIIADQLIKSLHRISPVNILEIGCGTGILTEKLHQKYPQANITAIDISSEMVKYTLQKYSTNAKIKVICCDAETYAMTESYDLIISSMTLHWLDQFYSFIKKCQQHLTDKGVLTFAMLENDSLQEWKLHCIEHAIKNRTPLFPIKKQLQEKLTDITFQFNELVYTYKSLYDFLRSLKLLGARATDDNIISLSFKKLRHLIKKYNFDYPVTYHVVQGSYQNGT